MKKLLNHIFNIFSNGALVFGYNTFESSTDAKLHNGIGRGISMWSIPCDGEIRHTCSMRTTNLGVDPDSERIFFQE